MYTRLFFSGSLVGLFFVVSVVCFLAVFFFFFFQAEDGIRDLTVTGVQTCALPISVHKNMRNLPLIILPHGGPHGIRDYWGYETEAVAFANAGYAVLKVNYRGSGGYGREFHYN